MIPSGVTVYLALGTVDLRWGFDLLAGVVKDRLRADPQAGDLFIFLNARRTRVKILFYDQNGYCMLYKRLDHGTFVGPMVVDPSESSIEISSQELTLLLQGVVGVARAPGSRRRKAVH